MLPIFSLNRFLLLRSAVLACCVLVFACDDTKECEPTSACTAPSVDLAIQTLSFSSGATVDVMTGTSVLFPGIPAQLQVVIANKGNYASAPAPVVVCIDVILFSEAYCDPVEVLVRSLAAGATDTLAFSIVLDVPQDVDSLTSVHASIELPAADTDTLNNRRQLPVLVARPHITGSVSHPATVRVGDVVEFAANLVNQSRLADAPAGTVTYCFDTSVESCGRTEGGPGLLATQSVTAIPRLSTLHDTAVITMPVRGSAASSLYRPVTACIWPYGCATSPGMNVLPNVDLSCAAQTLVIGITVTGETGTPCYISTLGQLAAYSFNGVAGTKLRAIINEASQPNARLRVIDRDGRTVILNAASPLEFVLPTTDRYHIIVSEAGTFKLTVTQL